MSEEQEPTRRRGRAGLGDADPHILKLAAISADMVLAPDFDAARAIEEIGEEQMNILLRLLARGFRGLIRSHPDKPRFRVRAARPAAEQSP